MVSERPWVRVQMGPHSFSAPVTFAGSVWVLAQAAKSKLKESVSSAPAWFRADSRTYLINWP